jgi:hypothetical protein
MKRLLACMTLLAVSLAASAADDQHVEFSFNVTSPLHTLPFRVIDAEFSPQLNAIVAVAESPNSVRIYYPDTQVLQTVLLEQTPRCVSVGPDGTFAAAGHDGHISYVDLQDAELVSTLDVSCDVLDIVLAGNGYVYAFPRRDQWESIRSVHIATNVETPSGGYSIYAGTLARLHPDRQSMYGANNGLSPSDIEKYDISGGNAIVKYDSPYHGDYSMCGNLWISADGARIFTACGNVFRSTNDQATDMRYAGKFSNDSSVRWVSTSATAGIAMIARSNTNNPPPDPVDDEIRYYTSDFYTYRGKAVLPPFTVEDDAWTSFAKWHFFNAAGTRQYVVVQAHPNSGFLYDFGVVTIDCTNATVTLDVTAIQVRASPAAFQVLVTGTPGCGWRAVANEPWLNSLSSGVSDGTVAVTVAANSSASPRSGTLTIGNATFTVHQLGVVPLSVAATPTSPTSVLVSWTSPAADYFEVWRSSGGAFELVASPTAANFTDTVTAGTAYVYKVRAMLTGGGLTAFSTPDYAYPFAFADTNLAGAPVRAVHMTELRSAVNAIRAAAGLGAATFTDATLTGVAPKRIHITELRDRLNEARAALGMPAVAFSSLPVKSVIFASTTQELRNFVQ